MTVKTQAVDSVVVVTVKGKLMGGKETDEVHDQIRQVIAQGKKKIVFDISKVRWMNSRGLGMLMACYTSVTNSGGELKLAGVSEKINSLFMITKLITIFKTYNSVDDAVKSF
jgi:anti-sigma B factor antagonist